MSTIRRKKRSRSPQAGHEMTGVLLDTMNVLRDIWLMKDKRSLFDYVVHTVPLLVHAEQCSLFEKDSEGLLLQATNGPTGDKDTSRTMAADAVHTFRYDLSQPGFTTWVFNNKLPLNIRNVAEADDEIDRILDSYARLGLANLERPKWSGLCHDGNKDDQFMGVPIMAGERCVGVLRVSLVDATSSNAKKFSQYYEHVLLCVASQIGSLLQSFEQHHGRQRAIQVFDRLMKHLEAVVNGRDNTVDPFQEVANATVEYAVELLAQTEPNKRYPGHLCAMIRMHHPETKTLDIIAIESNFGDIKVPPSIGDIAETGGLSALFFQQQKVKFCNDVASDPDLGPLQASRIADARAQKDLDRVRYYERLKSIIIVPLTLASGDDFTGQGEPWGVLTIVGDTVNGFDPDFDEPAIKLFGRFCTVSILLSEFGARLLILRRNAWIAVTTDLRHQLKNRLNELDALARRLKDHVMSLGLSSEVLGVFFLELQRKLASTKRSMQFVLSRMTLEEGSPRITSIGLVPIINALLETYRDAFPNISFEFVHDEDVPTFMASEIKVFDVLDELLSNATNATKGAGTIRIEAKQERRSESDSRILLRIVDSGPGFSDAARLSAFETGFTTGLPGSTVSMGLGLGYVKAYIQQWGGRITLPAVRGSGVVEISIPVKKNPSSGK